MVLRVLFWTGSDQICLDDHKLSDFSEESSRGELVAGVPQGSIVYVNDLPQLIKEGRSFGDDTAIVWLPLTSTRSGFHIPLPIPRSNSKVQ